MKRLLVIPLSIALAVAMVGTAAAKPQSGPGKVQVGVDASEWSSDTPTAPGIVPVGGSGQINGEFVVAERLGIQIGLRAQERFVGPLEATPNQNGKVGIYEAATGTSDSQGRATWNYDWHVDLRDAHGVAAGTTLSDYFLTLETDAFSSQFGSPVPIDLTFGGAVPGDTVLYQQSFNPVFGSTGFDPDAVGSYSLSLVLTPKTFNGPPLVATIQVNVTNP